MICHKCGNPEIKEEDNFCVACGAKLKKTCKCWVLKKDNYDCGKSSCPGYKILTERTYSEAKYKIGDKVRIRQNLCIGTRYDGVPFREEMSELCGQDVTIDQVFNDEDGVSYYIEEDQNFYYWTEDMFEDKT